MVAIAPGAQFSTDNPIFETFVAANGFLVDPHSLEFAVFDATNEDAAPTQVFPATAGDWHAVDLVLDKVGTGHFVATWTAPNDLDTGRHLIRWRCVVTSGGALLEWSRAFDVLPYVSDSSLDSYALVADVRGEGVAASIKNSRIAQALARSADLIRAWTGRDFAPRKKTLSIDHYSPIALGLNEPICAINTMRFDGSDTAFDRESYRVYNRHLTQTMHSEDDRDAPRIEFIRGMFLTTSFLDLRAPRISGAQEVIVDGVFGYTQRELRGSPVGVTPPAIARANVLLALRDLPKAATQGIDPSKAQTVKKEKTREQEVEYDTASSGSMATGSYAPFTGDPEIDRLLLTYVQPLTGTGV